MAFLTPQKAASLLNPEDRRKNTGKYGNCPGARICRHSLEQMVKYYPRKPLRGYLYGHTAK